MGGDWCEVEFFGVAVDAYVEVEGFDAEEFFSEVCDFYGYVGVW